MPFLPEEFMAAHVDPQVYDLDDEENGTSMADVRAALDRAEDRLPEGNVECDGCRGDGVYYGRGRVENGKFVGFTGTCYRCGGKGSQTPADVKRNSYYDNRIRRF